MAIPFWLVAQGTIVPIATPILVGAVGLTAVVPVSAGFARWDLSVSPEMVGALGSPDFLPSIQWVGDGSINVLARFVIAPFPPSAPLTSIRVEVFDPATGLVVPDTALYDALTGQPKGGIIVGFQRKGPANIEP